MFHRRWLDKITLRSWLFLLFVDSLSSWVHSLQTDSYPSGMNAANRAFPFIFQALPGADTIALLSLLIQRVGSHPDKSGPKTKWKAPISAALPTALQTLIHTRHRTSAPRLGKRGILILWAQRGEVCPGGGRGGQGQGVGVVSPELELPTLPTIGASSSWSWGMESSFCQAEQRISV